MWLDSVDEFLGTGVLQRKRKGSDKLLLYEIVAGEFRRLHQSLTNLVGENFFLGISLFLTFCKQMIVFARKI